jgi:hypothetical protein
MQQGLPQSVIANNLTDTGRNVESVDTCSTKESTLLQATNIELASVIEIVNSERSSFIRTDLKDDSIQEQSPTPFEPSIASERTNPSPKADKNVLEPSSDLARTVHLDPPSWRRVSEDAVSTTEQHSIKQISTHESLNAFRTNSIQNKIEINQLVTEDVTVKPVKIAPRCYQLLRNYSKKQ